MKYRSISLLESVSDLQSTDKVLISRYIGGTTADDLKSRHIEMTTLSSFMMTSVNNELNEIKAMIESCIDNLNSIV